jgi:hypothetical protein
MTFKPSILNVAAGLFIIGCIVYTIFNYGQLSKSEGWGIVAMFGLLGVGVILLLIDFIIQEIFKNKTTVNVIGAAVVVVAAVLLCLK